MGNPSNAWAGSFALVFLVSATPLFSQNNTCQLNFEQSRSAANKKVLETHQEFTILDVATALRRLQAQLPGVGVTILGLDIENGVIRGEKSMPHVDPFPVVVTVTAIPFGTRVRFRAEPSAGMIVDERTKDTICEILRLANVEPPAQVPPRSPVISFAATGLTQGPIPGSAKVPAPPPDAPQIDPSLVKFHLAKQGCTPDASMAPPPQALGIVAIEVDLSVDLTALPLLQMGIAFAREKCPSNKLVAAFLRPGDPATFTDASGNPANFSFVQGSLLDYPSDIVGGAWRQEDDGWIVGYRNFPAALKAQQAAEAQTARQVQASLHAQQLAERKVQSENAGRASAFVKKYSVVHYVTAGQLAANPFVYKGNVVAIIGQFERMVAETQGLFSFGDQRVVVSGVPSVRFTRQGSWVVLAGKVVGNAEIKLPRLGPTLVPQLSFVGSAFCENEGCREYLFNRR